MFRIDQFEFDDYTPSNYYVQQGKSGVADDPEGLKNYLINIYRILLTRGVRGLKKKGYKILEAPSRTEVREAFGCNFVALEPGHIVLPEGNPRTQELLEQNGVKVETVDISEICKGKGALHCITAYLKRG